ncbi:MULTISPECIES: RICIN domain-containing protein [unclassified Pseudofrankia]|uniref:RICIN domain-containing protein n=1 Tax=unclassified Pseudofrankia TaxID=2994372 RepID=UPI0012FF78A0|nr:MULTISPECIES: RICIN domain-containing protein [unclassified Pseudofrankia]MDT3443340.1 RICIN domain-containing protein [Pseudofrankia sp. BMG5.37]
MAAVVLGVASPARAASPYYQFKSVRSGLTLDVNGGSTAPGAQVIQWSSNGGDNQRWALFLTGNQGQVVNKKSGLCLNFDGVVGHTLTQEPCDGRFTELWQFQVAADGTFQLRNYWSGLYADVYGDSLWPGAPIDGWYGNGALNQQFVSVFLG